VEVRSEPHPSNARDKAAQSAGIATNTQRCFRVGRKTAALGDSLGYAAKTKITSEIEQMKQEIIERLRRGPDGC